MTDDRGRRTVLSTEVINGFAGILFIFLRVTGRYKPIRRVTRQKGRMLNAERGSGPVARDAQQSDRDGRGLPVGDTQIDRP
jgi:hypothetical protein